MFFHLLAILGCSYLVYESVRCLQYIVDDFNTSPVWLGIIPMASGIIGLYGSQYFVVATVLQYSRVQWSECTLRLMWILPGDLTAFVTLIVVLAYSYKAFSQWWDRGSDEEQCTIGFGFGAIVYLLALYFTIPLMFLANDLLTFQC